ncbi:MAG: hypothetical protein M3Y74_18625 [Chloroflexota bacterium]|nr:hypothetical protein [Chloroflexota bacterium]
MKEITPEGTRYVYVSRREGIPGSQVVGSHMGEIDPVMTVYLSTSTDIRLVLLKFPWLPEQPLVPYYLYWDDGRDLDLLDTSVENGTYTDADFARAFKTEFVRTLCLACRQRWPSMVMPGGDSYLGAPGLIDEKFKKARFLRCPHCATPLRLAVVKVVPVVI